MQKSSSWPLYIALISAITVTTVALVKKYIDLPKNKQNYYILPDLPYAYNALEPYIDAKTMELHHDKHHRKYVDELNTALKNYPDLANKPLEELLENLDQVPENIRVSVRNNGGGHLNHSTFWLMMVPNGGGEPEGELKEVINKHFGSFDQFKEKFNQAAKTRFGSGWAWLCLDNSGNLVITSTANQDTPLSEGLTPIVCLDVWEHAYYLKYNNRRPDYIDAWWKVINWKYAQENYSKAKSNINK